MALSADRRPGHRRGCPGTPSWASTAPLPRLQDQDNGWLASPSGRSSAGRSRRPARLRAIRPDAGVQQHVPAAPRRSPGGCRSRPSRSYPPRSAVPIEPAFQGSMYSSIRCSAGMVQPNEVSAISAADARPRPGRSRRADVGIGRQFPRPVGTSRTVNWRSTTGPCVTQARSAGAAGQRASSSQTNGRRPRVGVTGTFVPELPGGYLSLG